ncbi:hypothetical protein EU527_09645 [Candidatus Thorarchaeota archaeon]|nr:MAG: hypothetical protein EU527_09645 [Candidatus Thorarchaeota archaeon]
MNEMKETLRHGFFTADMIERVKISTGTDAIDTLLEGGVEAGLTHLFYGDRSLHSDFLRFAVHAQMPEERGGTGSPVILIDSANIIKVEQLTDISYELELEPEEVMDRVYITRAFNSSQTYDLIMNQMDGFFRRVPAKVLLVTGLPNLYIEEGMSGENLQQISHMISKIMTFSLRRDTFTLVSAPSSQKNKNFPAGGRSLASNCQVHVHVEEANSYMRYTLAKHPQFPIRTVSRAMPKNIGGTLPLSYFFKEIKEERR